MNIPEVLKRREERMKTIAHTKEEIKKRAQERFEREQAKFGDKQAIRKVNAV